MGRGHMTVVYEAVTKHTKETLKAFLRFKEQVGGKHPGRQLLIIAVCSIILRFFARTPRLSLIFTVIGIVMLLLALIQRPLSVYNLGKTDPYYQSHADIRFVFGEREFRILRQEEEIKVQYGEIAYIYADETYFYLSVNNNDLHIIGKNDFVQGEAEGFYEFLSHKTGKTIVPVRLSWAMKWEILKEAWKNR